MCAWFLSINDQINDLNIVAFALRSVSGPELTISEILNDIENAKSCMRGLKGVSAIYQNYFVQNNISKDIQKHLTMQMTQDCLLNVQQHTPEILKFIRPLNYPLPEILSPKIDVVVNADIDTDPLLEFELKLFNAFRATIASPMSLDSLTEIQKKEGFNDLNYAMQGSFIGFITYGTIIDDWKYKDLRLNKTIDGILKEWNTIGIIKDLGIHCKNEFLTLRNGLILISKE